MNMTELDKVDISEDHTTVPNFSKPMCLKIAAATIVVRLLIYEDDDCEYYRWDPVQIWQFEPPARKKRRKAPEDSPRHITEDNFPHPPSPWNGIKIVRDWWHEKSNRVLGGKMSLARKSIIEALERQSWCSTSEEETVLFFLLSLCIDPYPIILRFEEFREDKCEGLRKIINNLGPYPIENLIITHNVDFKDTKIIETIIKHAPNLEIVQVPYFLVSSEFLKYLRLCKNLVEFSIYGIGASTFFSEENFYKCFFDTPSTEEVNLENIQSKPLPKSFKKLKVLNFTEYEQTSNLIDAFYNNIPGVSIGCLDLCGKSSFDKFRLLSRPYKTNPYLRIYTDQNGIFKYDLSPLTNESVYLSEFFISLKYDDNSYKNKEFVERLKHIMKNSIHLSSFGFVPFDSLSVISYIHPVFSDHGRKITKLDVSYFKSTEIHVGLLCEVLNSCPNLRHLCIGANVPMTKNFVTNHDRFPSKSLSLLCNLETFILHGEPSSSHDNDFQNELLIGNIIANCAIRLRRLSLSIRNKLLDMRKLPRNSMPFVIELHLIIGENAVYDVVTDIMLAPFPNLKALSVEAENNSVNFLYDPQADSLKKSELFCTGKRPSFVRSQFKYGPGQDFPEPEINLPDLFMVQ